MNLLNYEIRLDRNSVQIEPFRQCCRSLSLCLAPGPASRSELIEMPPRGRERAAEPHSEGLRFERVDDALQARTEIGSITCRVEFVESCNQEVTSPTMILIRK